MGLSPRTPTDWLAVWLTDWEQKNHGNLKLQSGQVLTQNLRVEEEENTFPEEEPNIYTHKDKSRK